MSKQPNNQHLVQTRISPEKYKKLIKAKKKAGYTSTSEFIRQILINFLEQAND